MKTRTYAAIAVLSLAALTPALPLACVSNDNAAPSGEDAGFDASGPVPDQTSFIVIPC